MEMLAGLAGLVVGAFIAWEVARGYATAEMNRLWARSEEKIRYWQAETKRAKAAAAQAEDRVAAWMDGCQQGREDALSLARSLARHPAPPLPSASRSQPPHPAS
ncbi:MAG: hypothetical protein J2P25_13280 [Nocardiopsaceae bacterium]|nr:hypothetical protein [Nocardiopsaceae bacterium]